MKLFIYTVTVEFVTKRGDVTTSEYQIIAPTFEAAIHETTNKLKGRAIAVIETLDVLHVERTPFTAKVAECAVEMIKEETYAE